VQTHIEKMAAGDTLISDARERGICCQAVNYHLATKLRAEAALAPVLPPP
jgi:hypothetical protein